MSDPKLTVMQKKIFKLLRTSLPKYVKQKATLFGILGNDSKNFRSRMTLSRQCRPKFRKVNQSVNKNLFKKKENKPIKKFFINIYRCLSDSIDTNFGGHSKVTAFWKALLPQVLNDDRKLSTVWIKPSNEMAIPKFSRGFKGHTNGSLGLTDPSRLSSPEGKAFEQRNEVQMFGAAPKELTEQCSEITEQRFYTESQSTNRKYVFSENLTREKQKSEKNWSELLPPPQKCRLSCPLPPPEFYPQEVKEYFPNYQSPKVRFSSLPEEFLPPKRAVENVDSYTMRDNEQFLAKKKKVFSSSTQNLNFSEMGRQNIKNSKNYLNLINVKSQLYKHPREVIPKMKALLFEPTSLELNYDTVNAPTKIFKDEVLVQVTYSGVCGTDFFITEGKVSCGNNPVILGHEISGKVYATGSGVSHVKPGDNIVVNAYTACSVCRYCSRGLYSACANEGLNNSIGITKNGGWAEFVVVKKSQVYKIPVQLGLDQAALIQPLSCILSAMSKLNISHGMNLFIQGLGLSGCLWASVLHSRGHHNVFVTDKSKQKIKRFESLNINYAFVPPEDIGEHKADVIIECTGSPLSIEKSFNILNPSGQMCFFGKPNPVTEVRCIPYEIIQKEITILGNAGNFFRFSEAINVAKDLGNRYLDFEKLGVGTFDLEDYKEAFQMKKSGKINKVIFKFES